MTDYVRALGLIMAPPSTPFEFYLIALDEGNLEKARKIRKAFPDAEDWDEVINDIIEEREGRNEH